MTTDRQDHIIGDDGRVPIDTSGLLQRGPGGFVLRGDDRIVRHLILHRVPVDLVEKRVRVIGTLIEDGAIEADGVQPA